MDKLTTRETLDIVMNRMRERSPQLAELVQQSIDEGKLVAERSELKVANHNGKKPSGEHVYERRMPLSDEEALAKVVLVLRAYLVELPLCTSSAFSELSISEVASAKSKEPPLPPLFRAAAISENSPEGEILAVQQVVIERAHEGMLLRDAAVEPLRLNPFSSAMLDEQQENLNALAQILGVKQ